MENITINELLEKEQITLSELSKRTGLSLPLLSKIKNNKSPITSETQEHFNITFPQYFLTCSTIDYKKEYEGLLFNLEYIKSLNEQIVNEYQNLLENIGKLKFICEDNIFKLSPTYMTRYYKVRKERENK